MLKIGDRVKIIAINDIGTVIGMPKNGTYQILIDGNTWAGEFTESEISSMS